MRFSSVLILIGAAALAIGVLSRFFPGMFSWFGNLPGDIRVEGERTRVFVPITSMVVVSIIATIIINVLARLFGGR